MAVIPDVEKKLFSAQQELNITQEILGQVLRVIGAPIFLEGESIKAGLAGYMIDIEHALDEDGFYISLKEVTE